MSLFQPITIPSAASAYSTAASAYSTAASAALHSLQNGGASNGTADVIISSAQVMPSGQVLTSTTPQTLKTATDQTVNVSLLKDHAAAVAVVTNSSLLNASQTSSAINNLNASSTYNGISTEQTLLNVSVYTFVSIKAI